MADHVEGGHLSVGDDDAFRIAVFIDLAANCEAGLGAGRGDQIDDDATRGLRYRCQPW